MSCPSLLFSRIRLSGFTLAELLIAVLILGEIATFTIPKIINSQQNGANKAKAKEAAAMVSSAYQQYRFNNTATSGTTFADLTQYMNYVKYDTSSVIDQVPTLTTITCSATEFCLFLHNGGVLSAESNSFGGTNTTNALRFTFDPDGKYGGSTSGISKSVQFTLYYNGRITTRGTAEANSTSSGGTWGAVASYDPSWFSWD
jgi:type II secretory pathway pseudopilin PulG